jgi:2-phospho-L-lactate guanylyltransferase (CobY/MobA/RfbA family)
MQMLGSAITYATRYSILSLVGLSPDVDNDAATTSVPIDVTPKFISNAVTQAFKPVELPLEQIAKLKEDLLGLWEMKKEVATDAAPARAESVEQILANGFTKPTKDGEIIELETSELIRIQTWLKGL